MEKIDILFKNDINCGSFGPLKWSNVLSVGLLGQGLNGILSLANQIVYLNNPNPYYKFANMYDDSSSRMYIRGQNVAHNSSISMGNPYI